MLWFHLDLRSDRGDFYKGYALSPYTVLWSVCEKPNPIERQLILFGPSGRELNEAKADVTEAYAEAGGRDPALLERRRAEVQDAMLAEGVQVKTASTAFYLLVGLVLLGFNRRRSG